ncbi:MAG: hypothetical protein M1296_07595 [Chloroflexi bacterium]|nr:hypothetical protein [Chloroflexota bacterium]
MNEDVSVMDELPVADMRRLSLDAFVAELFVSVDVILVDEDEECSTAFAAPCEEAQLVAMTVSSSNVAHRKSR